MKLFYYTTRPYLDLNFDTAFAKDNIKIEGTAGVIPMEEVKSRSLPPLRYKVTITVHESDSSYRYRSLMEKTQLVLKFSLPEYIEFPVGTWCEWMNQTFYLGCPANFKKNGERNFEYTLNMGTLENGMADYKLHNTVDGRLKWSMCAKPHEFIEEIVKNLNERDGAGTWSVGDCIDAPEKTVEFNHTYIDAALQAVSDAFGTEWEISENLTISLHKVEYFKTDPLALSYGRGNGFVPGVGRTSQSDEKPIKRLYVEGTDRNIDRATYGAAELRLPKGKTLKYDGSHYEGEEGFDEANAHTYTSDADGTYIYRSDKISQAVKEDSLDCSEIYPSRVGQVSSLVVVDTKKNFYDIIDNSIPADLDFSAYIIPGETMTMIFQTGMLAGKEFEVAYYHEAKMVNGVQKAGKRFEIKPQEYDGVMMPNETFKPVAGGDNPDQYAIFGIQLPEQYICNDADKSGASWEMFKEAARHLYEHEEQKFTFSGELQGLWAKRNWMEVGGKLKVGGYVLFTDKHFAKNGTLIRITGIKDYLTAPYSPTIEISNSISGSSTASQNLRTIEQTEVVIKDTEERMKLFTKRRFRDAKETVEMLEDAMLNFDNSISPVAVQTMAMLVGDESLQFQFVQPNDTKEVWQRVDDTITYNQESKRLHIDHCFIEHLTLGIKSIKANRDGEEYRHWEMEEYESPVLDQPDKKYYLYAAVNKTVGHGGFLLSSKAIPFKGENGNNGEVTVYNYNYYLLVGVLNSEYGGERSFAPLYGFTEILPGRITTDKIVANDGLSFLDLANNAMHIGDKSSYVDWNNLLKNALSLKNASINITNQSGKTMVEFSGVDGHGQLAGGNISWDKNGNIIANNGTFNDVLLRGALRTPFVNGTTQLGSSGLISISTLGLHNNNCVVIPGYEPPGYTHFAVPFTSDYNGFRATIINYDYDGRETKGTIANNAPSGYYYYEDGEQMSELRIKPNQGVEMIGIGEGDKFIGWLILNRFTYATKNAGEGFQLRAIFAGKVEFKDGTPTMTKCKRFDDNFADHSGLSMNYPINGDKYVTIQLPDGLFSSADNYTVLLSAERLRTDNGPGAYASVIHRDAKSFTVYTGDDDSFNAANFTFIVLATHLW